MKSWHLQFFYLLLLVFAYKSNAEETASNRGTIIPGTQDYFIVTRYYRSSRELAESDCNELEGKLASILSEREQIVAQQYLKEEEEKKIRAYYRSIHNSSSPPNETETELSRIGVKYFEAFWMDAQSNKKDIFWSDGTKVVYQNFYPEEMETYYDDMETNQCTTIWNLYNGSWFFSDCHDIWASRALCRIHSTTTPPPTTTRPPSCPESWHLGGYPTSCQLLLRREPGLDWYQAAGECEVFGAELAYVTSKEEKDFAQWLMVSYEGEKVEEVWVQSSIYQVPTGNSSNGNNLEVSGNGKCITLTRKGELKTQQCNVIIGGAVCQSMDPSTDI